MTPPTLPDKATWREFRRSRHNFEPGVCELCYRNVEKLYLRRQKYLCSECWWQLEDEENANE